MRSRWQKRAVFALWMTSAQWKQLKRDQMREASEELEKQQRAMYAEKRQRTMVARWYREDGFLEALVRGPATGREHAIYDGLQNPTTAVQTRERGVTGRA
jgi:hypothetical protein